MERKLAVILDCVEDSKDELVELARELIRIPSVYRPESGGSEEGIAHFLTRKLEELGLEVTVEEVAPGRPNVIAILKGQGGEGKTLMFEAHSDVVTEGDPEEWTYPPFEAEIADGRIYGRGACDTKGNLAAAIVAIKAIRESGVDFPGKILLGIPVDEEGLMLGIKHFIEHGWAKEVDGAIICEPEDNQICITQKGALRAEVNTYGKMSHGAMPLAGINPIPPMAEIIRRLVELERAEIERLGKHPFLGFPSFTPTVLQAPVVGEPQLNVMPSRCRMLLDIRTIPGQEHEELKARLAKLVAEVEAEVQKSLREGFQRRIREELEEGLSQGLSFAAELNIFEDRPWTETPKDDPLVQAVDQAVRLVTGREPVYNGVPGATDGTFLWAWAKVPIVTIGAGDRLVPHQKDEWVEIAQLVETAKIYATSALIYLDLGRDKGQPKRAG